jgi:glycosyltransferase involved in cell wall biosynthesis
MKILFVTDTYHPHINNIYSFVCRMASLLRDKGHRVAVVAPSESWHFKTNRIDNIDVYAMPSLPLPHYGCLRVPIPFSLRSRLKKIITHFNPDVIHIQDHFILSKAVVQLNQQLNIPIIGTSHCSPQTITSQFKNKILKRTLEKYWWLRFAGVFNEALLVTTNTVTGASLIRPKLNSDVIPISNGACLETFISTEKNERIRKKYNLPDKPLLLYAGRLDEAGKTNLITMAVAEAVKTTDFYFVVAGDGIQKRAMERRVKELHLEDKVIFTGFVPQADLACLYALSRCFITDANTAFQNFETLQAMAAGLPVIAANTAAMTELVDHGSNGYLFNMTDKDAIVSSINSIFANDYLYHHMVKKSLEYSRDHDSHKTVASFERAYKSCYVRNIIIRHHREELVSTT